MSSSHEHARYVDLLERHLDGDISAGDREMLFTHLEFCEECRATLEAEERLLQRLRAVPKLVAPSTLRSNIVQQAMREQHERRTPLITDPRFSALLDNTANELRTSAENAFSQDEQTVGDSSGNADMPTFFGVRQPRRSRIRQTWRRASPYVAYTFVATAATAALYTGNFRGLPLAQEIQAGVRTVVAYTLNHARHTESSEPPVSQGTASSAVALAPSQPPRTNTILPDALNPAATYTAHFTESIRNQVTSARSALSAIARTANGTYPQPAELSGATIATIILKPTDAQARLGFEADELGTALASASVSGESTDVRSGGTSSAASPVGSAAPADQFTLEGHRYRTFRVRLPNDRLDTLVHSLKQYRVPPDDSVLHALTSQGRMQFTTERGKVAFFASRTEDLKDAVSTCANVAPGSGRAVQVVVVE
jgi:hypothetical protein